MNIEDQAHNEVREEANSTLQIVENAILILVQHGILIHKTNEQTKLREWKLDAEHCDVADALTGRVS